VQCLVACMDYWTCSRAMVQFLRRSFETLLIKVNANKRWFLCHLRSLLYNAVYHQRSNSLHKGLTENAGHENDGPSKLQDMKLQDMKLTDQFSRNLQGMKLQDKISTILSTQEAQKRGTSATPSRCPSRHTSQQFVYSCCRCRR